MIKEFREFISKGNVLDLAVAVIIGVAFGLIVTSLVNDIITPIIGMILGGIDFTSLAITVGEAQILYGNFIQAIVNFLIVAFVLFLIVRSFNKLRRTPPAAPAAPPAPTEEVLLLREIRDLLSRQGRM
jgi:large conductance mechanosensitive channel